MVLQEQLKRLNEDIAVIDGGERYALDEKLEPAGTLYRLVLKESDNDDIVGQFSQSVWSPYNEICVYIEGICRALEWVLP